MAQARGNKVATEKSKNFPFKDFDGVNTQADRTAIKENQFAWLENIMPIGSANLKVVPYQGASVATLPSGTLSYWKYVNINNTDYLISVSSAGALSALNLATFAITEFKVAGTVSGTVAISQWKNERILVIAGNGYFDWDGTSWTSLGGTTSAPSAGQTIASFAGRVWIGNARTVSFSAPNSYTDFQTASAGGSFIVTDETLHSNIFSLFTANNFLYVVGESSFNVVSNVQVVGSPAITVFSNTNISALIGSRMPLSIFPFYRTVGFATQYGFYGLFGSTTQKISDDLDGIFPLIDFTKPVSAGVCNLFNILCMCFSFTYNDPIRGTRPLLAILFNKKWFFASQGSAITLIAAGFQTGVPAMFGTDGQKIYKLFSDATSSIATTIQTALWPMGAPTSIKNLLKSGVEVTSTQSVSLTVTLDTEQSSIAAVLTGQNSGQWVNTIGTLGQWQNTALTLGDWIAAGFQFYAGNAEQYGRYLGYTITSNSPAYKMLGIMTQYEMGADWGDQVGT